MLDYSRPPRLQARLQVLDDILVLEGLRAA